MLIEPMPVRRKNVSDMIFRTTDMTFNKIPHSVAKKKYSLKAKGLMGEIYSNRKGWVTYKSTLVENNADGISSINSGLEELKRGGHLRLIKYRCKYTKQYAGLLWLVTDETNKFEYSSALILLEENGFEPIQLSEEVKSEIKTELDKFKNGIQDYKKKESPVNIEVKPYTRFSVDGKSGTNKINLNKNNFKDTKVSCEVASQHSPTIKLIFDFWNNNLRNITKHKDPSKKVYQTAWTMLENMLEGKPIHSKANGEPSKKLSDFIESHNIPEELTYKKWTSTEIKKVLRKIDKNTNKKMSLPNVLWNTFIGNKGFSYFLFFASENHIPNNMSILLDKFLKAIGNKQIDPIKRIDWTLQLEKYIQSFNSEIPQIEKMIEWYSKNKGQKYIPIIRDIEEFFTKFQKITDGMERQAEAKTEISMDKTPEKIIEDFFVNPHRTKMIIETVYTPAKEMLTVKTNGQLHKLAENITKMSVEFDNIQNQARRVDRNFTYGTVKLLKYYILWLNENDWITDRSPYLFDVNGTLFRKYLQHEKNDNFNLNPITGTL